MNKLNFAGHETFQCRNFWLKKGYDFLNSSKSFRDESAILDLGVGKNMVASINYWLKAFKLKEEDGLPSLLADKLFSNSGFDPYLENEGTLWLLQYFLIKAELASIFPLFFKSFRKSRVASQFTSSQLFKFLKKESERAGLNVAENTLRNDIKVFIKTYVVENKQGKNMEDDLSSILIDLNLIDKIEEANIEEGSLYHINVTERKEIPSAVLLFCLLDSFPEQESISFEDIQEMVADAFACNPDGLETHIEKIIEEFLFVVYKEDAGRKEVQIKGTPNKWEILEEYYNG